MDEVYIRHAYNGRVLTDFDELENHFDGAIFGLKKVMSLDIRKEDFLNLQALLPSGSVYINQLMMQQVSIKEKKLLKLGTRLAWCKNSNRPANGRPKLLPPSEKPCWRKLSNTKWD